MTDRKYKIDIGLDRKTLLFFVILLLLLGLAEYYWFYKNNDTDEYMYDVVKIDSPADILNIKGMIVDCSFDSNGSIKSCVIGRKIK